MATNLKIAINVDSQDLPYGSSGVEWVDISPANDSLIFSNGSDVVADGESIPSAFQISSAAPVLNGSEILIPHYFLADVSEAQLRESTLMGKKNSRYVLAFDFDGETTSEPILEVWDNVNMNSIDNACLGDGTASASWFRGVTTTDALPGVDWTGIRLAGSSDGHFLWLNNEQGPLASAETLYCNIYMVIPSTQTDSGSETPVMVVKYTTV